MKVKNIIVTVSGGVAYVIEASVPKGFHVDIVDFDNLKEVYPPDYNRDHLSKDAQEYLRLESPELWARLYAEKYTREDWQQEVADGNTILGFVEWVLHCQERDDYEPSPASIGAESAGRERNHSWVQP